MTVLTTQAGPAQLVRFSRVVTQPGNSAPSDKKKVNLLRRHQRFGVRGVMLALVFLLIGDTTPDRYQKGDS
jgi:hypothetical protein